MLGSRLSTRFWSSRKVLQGTKDSTIAVGHSLAQDSPQPATNAKEKHFTEPTVIGEKEELQEELRRLEPEETELQRVADLAELREKVRRKRTEDSLRGMLDSEFSSEEEEFAGKGRVKKTHQDAKKKRQPEVAVVDRPAKGRNVGAQSGEGAAQPKIRR